jgi:hypothetical protein
LGPLQISQPEFILASKAKFHRDEALALARDARHVWVANRGKVIRFGPENPGTDDEVAKLILGRSGTLRAPAIRVGEVFLVGFGAELYGEVFGA